MEFFNVNESEEDKEEEITKDEVEEKPKDQEKKKKKKIKDKDGKIEELETKITEFLNEKKELEEKLEFNNKLLLDTKKNSKLRILDLKNQLTEKSKAISSFKHDKRIDNVKKKTVFKEQESIEKSTLNQIKGLSDILAQTQSDLSQKEKENITLKEELDKARSELKEGLESAKSKLESNSKKLNEQKQKLELELNLKIEEAKIIFEKENQKLKTSLKEQQEKMVHEKAVMKILEGRIAELELTGGPDKVEQLTLENEELNKKVFKLELKLTELEDKIQSGAESNIGVSEEVNALKTEINQVKLRNKDLMGKLIQIQKMDIDFFEIKLD